MESFTLDREMKLPGVPLRGLVMLPGELLHFDIAREESRRAVRAAEEKDSFVFLTTQKDSAKTTVKAEDVFSMGVICRIRQTVNMPGGMLRALVLGLCRARIKDAQYGSYTTVTVETIEDEPCNPLVAEALRRRINMSFNDYLGVTTRINAETAENIRQLPLMGQYADAVANAVFVKSNMRQAVLDAVSVEERLKIVLAGVMGEVEITKLDKRIAAEVKRSMDQNQREYYLHEQIKAIRKELGETEQNEAEEYMRRLKEKEMPQAVREKLEREIARFGDLPAASHEQPPMRNYIECMLDLPWSEETKDDLDIEHARAILDNDHYGMEKVKQRILEHIAVARLTGKVNGQIICFVGPPGVGKTSIASSIARALGRNFVRMSLGGIHDEAEIRGHRRTYIGAMPGRIIHGMQTCGVMNPVFLLDEVDKMSSDFRGDPASALLEVLDPEQNNTFSDHYVEIPFDLSQVFWIVTANTVETIPPALLDRMEVVQLSSYTEDEKVKIAELHLLPKERQNNGLTAKTLSITEDALRMIIRGYTREAGVRNLERKIAAVCRKTALRIVNGEAKSAKVTAKNLHKYLGKVIYLEDDVSLEAAAGICTGLAWTRVGGELLKVEVVACKGKGHLALTGQLGDVMKESAQAGYTYIRSRADELGLDKDFYETTDIHIHLPEGAIPKDGPSAGITMATAMISALTGRKVKKNLAMTGEITLSGRVLPVGGIKEKFLAAHRYGVKTIIMPAKNEQDLEELPANVRAKMHFIPVKHMDEVLKIALED